MAKKWIRSLWEPLTNIETNKDCIAIGDINSDNDFKLVCVDFAKNQCRLKLLKDLTIIADNFLENEPVGIVIFANDPGQSPCIAVPTGSSLLIYRNMKPYYKCNLPQKDLNEKEVKWWQLAEKGKISAKALLRGLQVC